MDIDSIFKQIQQMTPSSFSAREQRCYQAEKMLMRQFMLMKAQDQVPTYLSTRDMKAWLLAGRSFLEEFQEIAKRAEARKLLVAELGWTSARRLCLNQMERELRDELEKERRLSLQLRRQVTLEGLQMFLSVVRPKAEQDARTFLGHLSSELLGSFTGSHTSNRSKRALLSRLRWTIVPLAAQMVDIALRFLLDEPEPPAQGSSRSRGLRSRTSAASAEMGELLADAAATCFCMNTTFTKVHLLHVCTSVARDMVRVIYSRFVDRSKTFHLMHFDESAVAAREGVIGAIRDMDERARDAAYEGALHKLLTEMTPQVCCVEAAGSAGENLDRRERGVRAFFGRMWRKMTHSSAER